MPGSLCSNGVAQAVPVASPLPTVSRSPVPAPTSAAARHRVPDSRCGLLPPDHAESRPRRRWGGSGVGALVLALTGVVDLLPHTGGSFTHPHLASSFPVLTLDIEGLSFHTWSNTIIQGAWCWYREGESALSHRHPNCVMWEQGANAHLFPLMITYVCNKEVTIQPSLLSVGTQTTGI